MNNENKLLTLQITLDEKNSALMRALSKELNVSPESMLLKATQELIALKTRGKNMGFLEYQSFIEHFMEEYRSKKTWMFTQEMMRGELIPPKGE